MCVLKLPGLSSPVAFDSIIWVEGHGNYSWVYFTDQPRYLSAKTLKWIEDQLPGFIRVHKSALLNPTHVAGVTLTAPRRLSIRMSNGLKLLVARRRIERVRYQLNQQAEGVDWVLTRS